MKVKIGGDCTAGVFVKLTRNKNSKDNLVMTMLFWISSGSKFKNSTNGKSAASIAYRPTTLRETSNQAFHRACEQYRNVPFELHGDGHL